MKKKNVVVYSHQARSARFKFRLWKSRKGTFSTEIPRSRKNLIRTESWNIGNFGWDSRTISRTLDPGLEPRRAATTRSLGESYHYKCYYGSAQKLSVHGLFCSLLGLVILVRMEMKTSEFLKVSVFRISLADAQQTAIHPEAGVQKYRN